MKNKMESYVITDVNKETLPSMNLDEFNGFIKKMNVSVASNNVKIPTNKNKLIRRVMSAMKPNILYLITINIITN